MFDGTRFSFSVNSIILNPTINPLGKITSRGRLEDVEEKRPDVLRVSTCGPIYITKGVIRSGTTLAHIQGVSLSIIHKIGFYGIFLFFLIPTVYQTLHCQSKSKTCYVLFWSYYDPGVSTKIVSLGGLDQNSIIRGRPQAVACRLRNI